MSLNREIETYVSRAGTQVRHAAKLSVSFEKMILDTSAYKMHIDAYAYDIEHRR